MIVASLLPGATELCCRLGVDPAAVSASCDYPPRIRDRPTVVQARVDGDGASQAIDEAVDRASEEGGVFRIDGETLAALEPDLILAQDTCDVCAVDRVHVNDVVAEHGIDTRVLTIDVHSLADLFETVQRLGRALDRRSAAAELSSALRARIDAVQRGVQPPAGDGPPRLAVLDWMDPPMVAGHWVPELAERAGARYGLATTGDRSRPREWTDIREYDPQILIVAPCGFEPAQTREHFAELATRPGWADLSAVRDGRVYVVDGSAYVNRPGPRLVDTLEAIAGLVPRNVTTGHGGSIAEPVEAPTEPLEEVPSGRS